MSKTTIFTFFVTYLLWWVCCCFQFQDSEREDMTRAEEDIFHERYQSLCPQKTICTVLSECRLLLDLMDKTCLLPSRMKELTCGYRKTESMVCCPNGGFVSPFDTNYYGVSHSIQINQTGDKLNQNCGKPHLNGWENGYTGLGSQPWVARIGFKAEEKETMEYPCCGSIVTKKAILTAAHCALAQPAGYSLHSVRIGDFNARTNPDCTISFCALPVQDIEISHIVVHPGFEKGIYRHDIALIILKTPISYSIAVQPICLLQNANIELIGRRGILVGWGKLAGQNAAPQTEQQIDLPVKPLEYCSRIYGKLIPLTSNHLCVGGEAKKDACSGFGGAPLVMIDHINNNRYYQVGMVSFRSNKCGVAGVPSVYTSIHHYYDWISANIP